MARARLMPGEAFVSQMTGKIGLLVAVVPPSRDFEGEYSYIIGGQLFTATGFLSRFTLLQFVTE